MKARSMLSLAAAIFLAAGTASAEGAALEEKGLELAGSSLRYPAVTGLADEDAERRLNEQIQDDLRITDILTRMNLLLSDENRNLTGAWSGDITGDVFSCVLSLQGAVEGPRNTHMWAWSNIDLRDGHEIRWTELFTDEEIARETLETYLEEEAAPEMSAHLQNSEVTPLPEGFRLEGAGITFLYPAEQLSTLSDRAGDLRIAWNEIRDILNLEEDGIAERIGAGEMISFTEQSAERIRRMTESGTLPDVPVKIGDSVQELTDRIGLKTDPDEYRDGRMFSPDGGCFRDVYVLSDALGRGWEKSTVQGLRMDRGCAWGLCIGETEQEQWRTVLGEADSTAALDAELAEAYRMEPGSCDYYRFGEYQLQLYCDEDGILRSIVLME